MIKTNINNDFEIKKIEDFKVTKFPVISIQTGEEYIIEIKLEYLPNIKFSRYLGKYIQIKLGKVIKKKFLFMDYEKFEILYEGMVQYKKFIEQEYTLIDIAEDSVLQYEYNKNKQKDYQSKAYSHVSDSIKQFNDWNGNVNIK